jgi:hypothetical protein
MIKKPREIKTVVLFGGAGLVGYQVARQIAEYIQPETIVICALTKAETDPAAEMLKKEFPHIKNIKTEYGNLFVRESLATKDRFEIATKEENLDTIFEDVFGRITDDKDNVGEQNLMAKIIMKYKPEVVIDTINAATGISYQDVKTCSQVVKNFRNNFGKLLDGKVSDNDLQEAEAGDKAAVQKVVDCLKEIKHLSTDHLEGFPGIDNLKMLDLLLVSQSTSQLIRHVVLLYRALLAANTLTYIKVGTCGTGGMGINIPFTHGEDKPSFTLMAKNAVAFAHTGLLFLLSRAPNGPVIKEIKPGAMIGFRKFDFRQIYKAKKPVKQWESKRENLGKTLLVRDEAEKYADYGDLKLVGVDTGENGFFTRAEYEAITNASLMEFMTPEEIARNVLFELIGNSTGKDVISAINSSVMSPTYLAGIIRRDSIETMLKMEKEKNIPSIALGELGPPQLSKLLYETYLFQQKYSSLDEMVNDKISAAELAKWMENFITSNVELQRIITSLGLPILLTDGKTILRGPKINIPESKIFNSVEVKSAADIDTWAKQGWVDLRVENMQVWQERAKNILVTQQNPYVEGSACYSHKTYPNKEIRTGEIVGWVLANEFEGYRVK